jgi:hypothetical protein
MFGGWQMSWERARRLRILKDKLRWHEYATCAHFPFSSNRSSCKRLGCEVRTSYQNVVTDSLSIIESFFAETVNHSHNSDDLAIKQSNIASHFSFYETPLQFMRAGHSKSVLELGYHMTEWGLRV